MSLVTACCDGDNWHFSREEKNRRNAIEEKAVAESPVVLQHPDFRKTEEMLPDRVLVTLEGIRVFCAGRSQDMSWGGEKRRRREG